MLMINRLKLWCLAVFFGLSITQVLAQNSDPDSVQLDKAVAYFNSGKYHEALLIFQDLDNRYKLNDRFKAYIGLCYYHEWDYKNAVKYLTSVIPRLGMLAPHERSVYYFSAAESYFLMEQYKLAIPFYEQALTVCYDREKGEIYYRLGFCYMFGKDWEKARDNYVLAEEFFRAHKAGQGVEARLAQVINMRKGCQTKIDEKLAADSIARAKAKEDSLRSIAAKIPLDSIITEKPEVKVDTATISKSEKPIITTQDVDEKTKKPTPPVDNNPKKKAKKQEDIAPINLNDLYKNKIEVGE